MSKLYLIKDHKLLSNNTEYIKELYEFTLDIIFMKLKNSDASIFHNYFSKFIRYMIDTIEDDGTIDYCIEECEKISIEGKLILHKYINILNPIFHLDNTLDKDLIFSNDDRAKLNLEKKLFYEQKLKFEKDAILLKKISAELNKQVRYLY
jgi:hypothetical protein